jgi:cytochrome c
MKRLHIVVMLGATMLAGAGQMPTEEAIARANGCFECHNIDKPGIGPSFKDIARRYRGNGAARKELVEVVRKGGKGNWTAVSKGVPMPQYSPRISDQEIEQLVNWALER